MQAAYGVAVVHAAAIVVLLVGALLALRWPRVVFVHAPVSLGILLVNVVGADCPLTRLEMWLRSRAGESPYDGGFVGHYLLAPLGLDVASTATQIGLYSAALLPNLVGYSLLALGALHAGRPRLSRTVDGGTAV